MNLEIPYDVGETINDVLTGEKTEITGFVITYGKIGPKDKAFHDNVKYWINSTYAHGIRYEYEISKVTQEQDEYEQYIEEYEKFRQNTQM